jgi:hypothetical protein
MFTRVSRDWLLGSAVFTGSFLLFLIEPMAARRLLPLLGGSAEVWITCLIFFQCALLLGYLGAHALATRLPRRTRALIYSTLLGACLLHGQFIGRVELAASTAHPVLSVFRLLAVMIGLPFFALSMTTPLLQSWQAGEAMALNTAQLAAPSYRFYAFSNFGSFLALVVYPWLLEPRYGLRAQNLLWRIGFAVFAVTCATIFFGNFRDLSPNAAPEPGAGSLNEAPPRAAHRVLWFLLAACGTLLLCAITNHLNQDVAAVPLLWILPLIAYLLSFVWAFSGDRFYPRRWFLLFLPVILFAAGYAIVQTDLNLALGWWVLFFCVVLLYCCMVCHGELHRLRPAPAHLTSFYLTIAAGGMIGSVFVGMVAPVIFRANYELACGLVLLALLAVVIAWREGIAWRVLGFTSLAAVVVLGGKQIANNRNGALALARNFYGALRVVETRATPESPLTNPPATPGSPNTNADSTFRALFHGTVLHGAQVIGSTRATPFYSPDSGIAMAIDLCCGQRPRRIGVIGLGAGSVAAYSRAGDVIRFYEIDPLIEKMATEYFTYLHDSPADIQIILGDGRVSLAQQPSQQFDVLAIDAFSGGAIPVHLLTREAIELYLRHLRPGGILAINITNVYLDLGPIVEAQARRAGLHAFFFESAVNYPGGYVVDWVLLSNNQTLLSRPEMERGQALDPQPGLRIWTDDYNSLFPVFSLRNHPE